MSTPLQYHHPGCFGCGPENPCSLGIEMHGEGERVWGELTIDERHQGAPGFAHGGAVAAAFDDAFGMILRLILEPAVTVHLEVDYRKPWLVGTRHSIEARVDRREGRKLFITGQARDDDGDLVAEASAVFLVVGVEHFAEGVKHARERLGRPEDLPW